MTELSPSLEILVAELGKLPGIGRKTALRLGLHLLLRGGRTRELAAALLTAAEHCRFCQRCGNLGEEELCAICQNPSRDAQLICVVEQVPDLLAIERMAEFRGVYHVLGGALSPLDGVGPEQLRVADLLQRVSAGGVREIVLATSATVEGDTTALFLQRQLSSAGLRISRLARGLPSGGSLESADQLTLARALDGRERLN
jgi:recombination protein RecR